VSVGAASLLDFDFGCRRLATIGDLVWLDANGDGVQGADESGVAGVTLKLLDAGGVERGTTTTDADGAYSFKVLPDDWTVRVTDDSDALSGHRPTTPSSLTLPVTVGGASALNYDFGYQPSGGDSAINVNTLDGAARDGRCSLAEALTAAETDAEVDGCLAGSGDDEIAMSVSGVVDAPPAGFRIESNVTVSGNVDGTTVSGGGGFDVVVAESGSTDASAVTAVTLADLTIAKSAGAGVEVTDHASGTVGTEYAVSLKNLRVKDNRGAGVRFVKAFVSSRRDSVRVSDSVLEKNRLAGAYMDACDPSSQGVTMTVVNSTVRGNRGGGLYNVCGHLRVEDSLIVENAGLRGGVYAHQGRSNRAGVKASTRTEVFNSTIAHNNSMAWGGDVAVTGSSELTPSLTIANNTITSNTTSTRIVGGVLVSGSADVSITNSVVAENTGAQCGDELTLTVNSGNASSNESCGFGLEGITLGYTRLLDNGGAARIGPHGGMGHVLTEAIDATSPLFDAGDAATCRSKDARGVPRPQGGGCDIGAYEALVIGDYVWEDTDGDRLQGDDETGIGDVTLELKNSDDESVATTTTDSNGAYSLL